MPTEQAVGLFLELQDHTFRGAFTTALARKAPGATTRLPPRPSVCGALEMAAVALAGSSADTAITTVSEAATEPPPPPPCWVPPLASLGLRSPTELRNPLSTSLRYDPRSLTHTHCVAP